MDDLMGKLSALLSDPESMRNLSELAAMLQQPEQPTAEATETVDVPPDADGSTAEMPGMDFGKLMAMASVIGQMQDDENTALLLALKPHLREERAKRVDTAVKLLRIYRIAMVLREQGILGDLLGS